MTPLKDVGEFTARAGHFANECTRWMADKANCLEATAVQIKAPEDNPPLTLKAQRRLRALYDTPNGLPQDRAQLVERIKGLEETIATVGKKKQEHETQPLSYRLKRAFYLRPPVYPFNTPEGSAAACEFVLGNFENELAELRSILAELDAETGRAAESEATP